MAYPSTKSVSSREQFQKSVHDLTSEESCRHKRNKSISHKHNPYELQHVSSLRVSPLPKVPCKPGQTASKQFDDCSDFGTEERDVWSRKSPVNKAQSAEPEAFTIPTDVSVSPSPHKIQLSRLPPLRPQIVVHSDLDERPKTRRGPNGPSAFEATTRDIDSDTEERTEWLRKAKFIEGTMTSRSSAVASTWSDSEYGTSASEAEETDSDATPKAARKRRSGSIDLREFQPPTLTPSAIKRTLFRRRESKKDKETDPKAKPKEEAMGEQSKPKKRLRKSMSKLQFLGEKMKIFGSSSQDLPIQTNANRNPREEEDKSVLDERKRKAEIAYAEQFGLKKQRDNSGFSNITSSPEPVEASDLGGNQKYDSSTVRCRSGTTRSKHTSRGSLHTAQSFGTYDNLNDHDVRKRPTRRELEKENQQLRALLRDSQAFKEVPTVYTSDSDSIPPVPPLKIRRSYVGSSPNSISIKDVPAICQDAAEPVPPVPPQHPNRRILSNVSNGRDRRNRRESFGVPSDYKLKAQEDVSGMVNPMQNIPKLPPTPLEKTSASHRRSLSGLPRSVSMIREEPENEAEDRKKSLRPRTAAGHGGKENNAFAVAQSLSGGRKEEWQWPDDVF